jgi:hypothetical protein
VNDLFLGFIAVATLAIAIAQLGVMVAASRLARRVERLVAKVDHDLEPLFAQLQAIGRDAAHAASVAAAQVDRADRIFADVAVRLDQTLNTLQAAIGTPAREGRALFKAFRAAMDAVRDLRRNGRKRTGRGDDEDALFI